MDEDYDFDYMEKVVSNRKVHAIHNSSSKELHVIHNSSGNHKCSKPKKTVKRKINLKHKVPSSKLIASCTKHRHTHKFL